MPNNTYPAAAATNPVERLSEPGRGRTSTDREAARARPRQRVGAWLERDIPRSRAGMAVALAMFCLPLIFLWFVSVLQLTGIGFIGIICALAFLSIGRLDSIEAGPTPWRRAVHRGFAIATVAVYLGAILAATVVVGTPIEALEPVVVVLVPALVVFAAGYAAWATMSAVRERASARSRSL